MPTVDTVDRLVLVVDTHVGFCRCIQSRISDATKAQLTYGFPRIEVEKNKEKIIIHVSIRLPIVEWESQINPKRCEKKSIKKINE